MQIRGIPEIHRWSYRSCILSFAPCSTLATPSFHCSALWSEGLDNVRAGAQVQEFLMRLPNPT